MIKNTENPIPESYILQEYDSLLASKSLGYYNCCEMTTVFLNQRASGQTFHVFTIFVFEERPSFRRAKEYLTDKPLRISDDLSLGIQRRLWEVQEVRPIVQELCRCGGQGTVDIGEGPLQIGKMETVPKIFVQQDSAKEVLLNKVLKNNFYNGSYLIEFFDVEKRARNLLDDGKYKKLTRILFDRIPIDLFTVSDRVGNFLFQFPSLNTNISYTTDERETLLHYQVHMDSRLGADLCLQLQTELEYDGNITGFGTAACHDVDTEVTLQVGDSSQTCRTTLVDLNSQLLLSRQEAAFMRQTFFNMNIGSQYGEQRLLYDDEGNVRDTVDIVSVENFGTQPLILRQREKVIEQRQYNRRAEELHMRREFRRYGRTAEKEEAVRDVIELMSRGEGGKVYLWDPYLTVDDLLDTWYYTKTFGMQLWAVTSREIADKKHMSVEEWIREQRQRIEQGSNHYGIRAELRCQWNGHGYHFHDRFLMTLPPNRKTRVWSLGTSVNSLGQKHHIIQSVEHSQMIVDAFEELWQELSAEECLVWKKG